MGKDSNVMIWLARKVFLDLDRKHRLEPVQPGTYRLVADAALVEQVFDHDRRNRTYIMTARRMISGEVFK